MIRTQSYRQFTEFDWPFQAALDEDNRWENMSQCILWEYFAGAPHEGGDLTLKVQGYPECHGVHTDVVLDNTIHRSRANHRYLKKRGIRFVAEPLGRSGKLTDVNQAELKRPLAKRREQYLQWIPTESNFGQGNNGNQLNYIRVKRSDTSKAWLYTIFLVTSLLILFRVSYCLWIRGHGLATAGYRTVVKALAGHRPTCIDRSQRAIKPGI